MTIPDVYMGPAMQALTERRRRFVMAMANNPFASHADWAREAGYSDVADGARVRAFEVLADPKVQAAVVEVARTTLGTTGTMKAVHALMDVVGSSAHQRRVNAAEAILDRAGFGTKQQIEVVHRDLTGDALMERIRTLAEKHGVKLGLDEPSSLRSPKVIEHKPE